MCYKKCDSRYHYFVNFITLSQKFLRLRDSHESRQLEPFKIFIFMNRIHKPYLKKIGIANLDLQVRIFKDSFCAVVLKIHVDL
jgi:hypothetical protein